jgi:hypothetical protein
MRPSGRRGGERSGGDAGIDPHHLGLGEVLDGDVAVLAAEARIARAALWQSDIGRPEGVDPYRAGLEPSREAMDAGHVGRPDAGRQAVGGAVGDAERVVVLEFDHRGDGPKISSCEMRISCSTPAKTVGLTK